MANITTQTIRVDLSTDKVIPSAFTHQNDTARTLVFDMYNGGMPYTMTGNTVKFAYKSPIVNGQYSVIAGASMASGTVSGNKVSVTLPSAYTAISGVGMLTMVITPTSGTVRPVNIRLVVQKSADGDDTVAGASDFPTTLQQIADEWYDENIANWLNENIESVYDAEAFGTAIDSWLDDHPEATTTVEDGSITVGKFASDARAKLIDDYYYSEITNWKERINDTTCYFVRVPVSDSNGNVISPNLKYDSDLTPLQVAQRDHTTFTCNGTVACLQNGEYVRGHVISKGTSVYNNTLTNVSSTFKYVSINEDRSVSEYSVNNTTQADMLGDGAYTVFCAYYKIVENGSAVDNSSTLNNEGDNVSTTSYPYAAIGVLSDNTLLFLATDGRTGIDKGLTSVEAAQIMLSKGAVNAWALDGGGSTSYIVKGSKYNKNIDGYGMEDRLIRITMNFTKDPKSDSVDDAYSKIGEEKQNLIQMLMPNINDLYTQIGQSFYTNNEIAANTDLNNMVTAGRFRCPTNATAASLANCPTSTSFLMTVEYISSQMLFYTIKDYSGNVFVRRNYIYSSANHFTDWVQSNVGDFALTAPTAYNNRVTVNNGGYCKLGKQVQVNMVCTVNSDLSANNDWLICTAFPKATYISAVSIGATATDGLSMSATINTNGSLVVRNIDAIPTETVLAVTGTYFCS